MKKRKYVVLMLLLSAFMMLYGCGDSGKSADNDYAPGNPQYDYDAWKAGQVMKGINGN